MRRPVIVSTSLAFAVVLLGASPPARGPGDQEVAAAAATSPAQAPPDARSPRNASYVIDARLDVKTHLLSATEEITWRNITAHAASEVRLHVYFNAWANDKTSYALANRLGPIPWSLLLMDHRRDDWGYCDIKSLTILPPPGESRPEVVPPTEFIQPNDGNVHDRTVLRVALPERVPPGGVVRLKLAWQAKVPRPFQRAGVRGEYFMLGQWFPKVGVLEADGTWNCHQFIQTEFYSDFGVYDVTLRVPAGWVVGATGRRQAMSAADGGRWRTGIVPRTSTISRGQPLRTSRCTPPASRSRDSRPWTSSSCCCPTTPHSGTGTSTGHGGRSRPTASGSARTPGTG